MKVTCSAPGKVLIAGGYIVLDPQYSGLVIGLTAKGYASTTTLDDKCGTVRVKSPQFINAEWLYNIDWTVSPIRVHQIYENGELEKNPNPFVQLALFYVINYFFSTGRQPLCWQDLQVTLQVDNAYYHQPQLKPDQTSYPKFNFLNCTLGQVHKTGLGSSAAMITSLIGSLFLSLRRLTDDTGDKSLKIDDSTKVIVHNLAQIAHCSAQGKVGSGFDVGAATWGSCIYRRFDPKLIEQLLVPYDEQIKNITFSTELRKIVSKKWSDVVPFQLPATYCLLMGDVAGGSSTPGMVKKVQQWQKENPEESKNCFDDLYSRVLSIKNCFLSSESLDSELQSQFRSIRRILQRITVEAKVDIEPLKQTNILDNIEQLPGVIGVGVPGAGGFDAQFCLAINHTEIIENVIKTWKDDGVVPMDVSPAFDGLAVE
ncbi:putative phosphomevalonate kinase [Schizosaccharomyces pombe]